MPPSDATQENSLRCYPHSMWAAATIFVATYSWLLSATLPFFSELVRITP